MACRSRTDGVRPLLITRAGGTMRTMRTVATLVFVAMMAACGTMEAGVQTPGASETTIEAPAGEHEIAGKPSKLANGNTCTKATECGSGFCSDTRCCDSACDRNGESCNLID